MVIFWQNILFCQDKCQVKKKTTKKHKIKYNKSIELSLKISNFGFCPAKRCNLQDSCPAAGKRYCEDAQLQKSRIHHSLNTNLMFLYRCGEKGHIVRDCPEEVKEDRKCYNCGDIGHLSRDCPDDRKSSNSSREVRAREPRSRVQECYR